MNLQTNGWNKNKYPEENIPDPEDKYDIYSLIGIY